MTVTTMPLLPVSWEQAMWDIHASQKLLQQDHLLLLRIASWDIPSYNPNNVARFSVACGFILLQILRQVGVARVPLDFVIEVIAGPPRVSPSRLLAELRALIPAADKVSSPAPSLKTYSINLPPS
jgi:hypothetical protein